MRIYRSQHLIRRDLQAHIYSANIIQNVSALKSLCSPQTRFCAVVKANAYGHGIAEVVSILKNHADFFAVASIYEAIHICRMTAGQPILILEPVSSALKPDEIRVCATNGFHCVISSIDSMNYLVSVLKDSPMALNLHINIETGMGRCGAFPDKAMQILDMADNCPNVRISGVFTHFSTADEEDLSYAYEQLDKFNQFLQQSQLRQRNNIIIHAANSAAAIKIPQAHFDMVRCGISMYGYYSRRMKNPPIKLTPALELQAPIVQIKSIPTGHVVSYGKSFVTQRDTLAALIPVGYADGYRRSFSNRTVMKIGNSFAPVIGRVCMDQLLLDVTDIPDAKPGQMVTVIDKVHDSPCGVYALADIADTICYEIPISVQAHVSRIVH